MGNTTVYKVVARTTRLVDEVGKNDTGTKVLFYRGSVFVDGEIQHTPRQTAAGAILPLKCLPV